MQAIIYVFVLNMKKWFYKQGNDLIACKNPSGLYSVIFKDDYHG